MTQRKSSSDCFKTQLVAGFARQITVPTLPPEGFETTSRDDFKTRLIAGFPRPIRLPAFPPEGLETTSS